jgi:methylthioribose-1-phosphate isomerase
MAVCTMKWENDALVLIDQTRLPQDLIHLECRDVETVAEAIESLRVRGAPAIGVAAAFGVVVGTREGLAGGREAIASARAAIDRLARTRPTAVNLFWALERVGRVLDGLDGCEGEAVADRLLGVAQEMLAEDQDVCRRIGKNGAELLGPRSKVLTHCNAGALATADYGTALAVVYAAVEAGKQVAVYADETRPLLQGARLTAWELHQSGIEVTVICDNMAAVVLRDKGIDCVIVGSDRIAANGDVANKIGTYGVAVLAREHGVPFYVAAPLSTIDMELAGGDLIPIEQRNPVEVTAGMGKQTVPDGVSVYNPAFDVTPNRLVNAIITERGVARAPYGPAFQEWFSSR